MYVAQCRLLAPRGPRTVPHGDAPWMREEREREAKKRGERNARKIYQPLCDFSARPQITRPPVVPHQAAVWVYVHDEYTFFQEHRRPRRWLILSEAREGRAVSSGSTFDWILSFFSFGGILGVGYFSRDTTRCRLILDIVIHREIQLEL